MPLLVADTGPINYLIQIGQIELIRCLSERVALPSAVAAELSHPLAPAPVRCWIATPPPWLEIHNTASMPPISGLDDGESAAIALAESLGADMVLIDDRVGVRVANSRGLRVMGTLGLLDLAAQRGMLDFAQAMDALKRTTFRKPAALLDALILKHEGFKT